MVGITCKYAVLLLTCRSAVRIATEFLLPIVEQYVPTIQNTVFPSSALLQAS